MGAGPIGSCGNPQEYSCGCREPEDTMARTSGGSESGNIVAVFFKTDSILTTVSMSTVMLRMHFTVAGDANIAFSVL